jgi:poly-gamma-glutamate synthesis protein (capsule biosynthesis protein)
VLAACTTEPSAEPPAPSTSSAPASPSSSEPSPTERADATCTEPLVITRPHARGPFRLSLREARGRSDEGVPASRVGPRMRVAVVDGVHPLKRPRAYPLQVDVPCPEGSPRRPRPVTLTLVGDVMLARGVASAAGGDLSRPLRATAPRLRRADLTVGNLESTLSRAGAPTQGGDSFGADPSAATALVDAGFDVVSLANNHSGDFGSVALVRTVQRLRGEGLRTFGAGRDLAAARRPAVVEVRGTTYGFLGFNAIGETPAAGPGEPGAVQVSMPPRTGPLDRRELERFLRDVRRLDRRVDAVVVMPHWGEQYTHRPWPVQRRVARALVRAGADLVVGGHPHWVQGTSMVGDAVVAHSLGNFVFDMDFSAPAMEGATLETVWWDGELKAAELVPYGMDASFTPRWLPWPEAREVLAPAAPFSGPAFRF